MTEALAEGGEFEAMEMLDELTDGLGWRTTSSLSPISHKWLILKKAGDDQMMIRCAWTG